MLKVSDNKNILTCFWVNKAISRHKKYKAAMVLLEQKTLFCSFFFDCTTAAKYCTAQMAGSDTLSAMLLTPMTSSSHNPPGILNLSNISHFHTAHSERFEWH